MIGRACPVNGKQFFAGVLEVFKEFTRDRNQKGRTEIFFQNNP
jgi:hypothetical protein